MPARTFSAMPRSRRRILDPFQNPEGGARRAFGVVLMGTRIAEIDQSAVAH